MTPKTMRAAVYAGPGKIETRRVPVPGIGRDEFLLKVSACGLCKTDVKKIKGVTLKTKGILKPPRVFGHEIVGSVEKIGSGLKHLGLKPGDRVLLFHHVPCLECRYCLHGYYAQCGTYKSIDSASSVGEPSGGGFAEYVRVPRIIAERGTIRIPEHASDELATFVEPTNCCLKGINKADIKIGDTVAIFGQGPVGLTLDQLARMRGATVIAVDLTDYRLKAAKETFGAADFLVNARKKELEKEIDRITSGRGVDVSIVAVESPKAVEQAITCTAGGGTIVFFAEYGGEIGEGQAGEMVDMIYGKEMSIHGCYSSAYKEHQAAADLIFDGKIKVEGMVSHVFGLEQLQDAVDLAEKRREVGWEGEKLAEKPRKSLKIIIKP